MEREKPGGMDLKEHRCQSYNCRSCGELHSLLTGLPHYCSVRIPDLRELGVRKSYCDENNIKYYPKYSHLGDPPEIFDPIISRDINEVYPEVIEPGTQYIAIDTETYVCQATGELLPYCLSMVKGCPLCAFYGIYPLTTRPKVTKSF